MQPPRIPLQPHGNILKYIETPWQPLEHHSNCIATGRGHLEQTNNAIGPTRIP